MATRDFKSAVVGERVMVQAIHPGPSRFSSMRRGPLFAFWQPFKQPLQLD